MQEVVGSNPIGSIAAEIPIKLDYTFIFLKRLHALAANSKRLQLFCLADDFGFITFYWFENKTVIV
jgi:hypothetical protein